MGRTLKRRTNPQQDVYLKFSNLLSAFIVYLILIVLTIVYFIIGEIKHLKLWLIGQVIAIEYVIITLYYKCKWIVQIHC
jgi:hypothetical protein